MSEEPEVRRTFPRVTADPSVQLCDPKVETREPPSGQSAAVAGSPRRRVLVSYFFFLLFFDRAFFFFRFFFERGVDKKELIDACVFPWVRESLPGDARLAGARMRACAVDLSAPIVGVRSCMSARCLCAFSLLPQWID